MLEISLHRGKLIKHIFSMFGMWWSPYSPCKKCLLRQQYRAYLVPVFKNSFLFINVSLLLYTFLFVLPLSRREFKFLGTFKRMRMRGHVRDEETHMAGFV